MLCRFGLEKHLFYQTYAFNLYFIVPWRPNLKAFISGEETSDRKAVSPKFRKGLPPTQMLQV